MRHWFYFFFNDTATTEIYTLSLHDALPISRPLSLPTSSVPTPRCERHRHEKKASGPFRANEVFRLASSKSLTRSEEHTSELQSRQYLVCRLLLEKKKSSGSKSVAARGVTCV